MTEHAVQDLEEIYDFLVRRDSPAAANRVLDRLAKAWQQLAGSPDRGRHPEELLALGIRDYRQLVSRPYRIIYRVIGNEVFIYLIADGRRDMRSLLARRLLSA